MTAVRDNYELRLIDNIVRERRASERMVTVFESQIIQNQIDISPIVASQERLADGISSLDAAMLQTNDTLGSLLSVVSGELAEIAYQQRLMNGTLLQILETLQAPLDTRAKELRRRAEDAYRNGWIDDAKDDFLESEQLNRYDFTVHHALGTIAFVHAHDLEDAKREFQLAVRYARPKSALDAAYALVACASVEEKLNALDEALSLSADAVEIANGECPEGYYAYGRYLLATGGDPEDAVRNLETAFWGNPSLALAAMTDAILKDHQNTLDEALDAFRRGLVRQTEVRLSSLEVFAEKFSNYSFAEAPDVFCSVSKRIKDEIVPQVKVLQSLDSIVDYFDAIHLIADADRSAREDARRLGRDAVDRLNAEAQSLRTSDSQDLACAEVRAGNYAFYIVLIPVICGTIFLVHNFESFIFSSGIGLGIFLMILCAIGFGILGWPIAWFLGLIIGKIDIAPHKKADPQIAVLEKSAHKIESRISSF